ncbi:MAG: penicillin-binding transpeptidase domain-containing protein [Bdellovibrionia bacterium]
MRNTKRPKILKLLVILSAIAGLFLVFKESPKTQEELKLEKMQSALDMRNAIASNLGEAIRNNHFPTHTNLLLGSKRIDAEIRYTLNEAMQAEAEKLLNTYKPDYAAIVLMEAQTGRILAMHSFQKDDPEAKNWNLIASFPAASVFKVVTATAAVDKAGVSPYHKIQYNGGAYTLYRKNVLSDKVTRWTNEITLKDAFARSINTAFGRLSIENLEPRDLTEYAQRFMFNTQIPTDFPVEMGVATVPDDKGFELAEVASGYNRVNRMSPVQGAMIAASIANDGNMVVPYLVDEVFNEEGESIYQGSTIAQGTTMTKESAEKVRMLMEQTVLAGTSRRSFRSLVNDRKFSEVEMGGKTGHLTGTNPKGRTDWFVGYAMDDEHKVAVAALTVNKEYWTVKSAQLGQFMFRAYFNNLYAQTARKTQASIRE